MQIINLISPNDIHRLNGQVAEMSQIDQPKYLRHFDSIDDTFLVGSCKEMLQDVREVANLMQVDHVVLRHFSPNIKGLKGLIFGLVHDGSEVIVVLGDMDFYQEALQWPVSIAFAPLDRDQDGYRRFEAIYRMVESQKLDVKRSHWFWELTNPAELAVYKECFTSAIYQTFDGVMSYRCYVDSYYGIRYSSFIGLPTPPIGGDVPNAYTWAMQDVLYHMNYEQLESFATGSSGSEMTRKHLGAIHG